MKTIEVVVGVICSKGPDNQDWVLLTKRPKGKHLEGLWEFPGGKVEPEEALDIALMRELKEEINFKEDEVELIEPLTYIEHHYEEISVALQCFYIRSKREVFEGSMIMSENQIGRWVKKEALANEPMPPANTKIVEALKRKQS